MINVLLISRCMDNNNMLKKLIYVNFFVVYDSQIHCHCRTQVLCEASGTRNVLTMRALINSRARTLAISDYDATDSQFGMQFIRQYVLCCLNYYCSSCCFHPFVVNVNFKNVEICVQIYNRISMCMYIWERVVRTTRENNYAIYVLLPNFCRFKDLLIGKV